MNNFYFQCNTDPDQVVYIAGARVLIYESTLNSTSMLIPATVYIHGGAWVGGKAGMTITPPCRKNLRGHNCTLARYRVEKIRYRKIIL